MPQVLDWFHAFLIERGLGTGLAAPLARLGIVACILVLCFALNLLAKRVLLAWLRYVIGKTETRWDDIVLEKRVFDRFSQINSDRSTPGSGLGLAVARAIARLHGGELPLHSHGFKAAPRG